MSAIRAAHIEANFDWDQLLAHIGKRVTRSVLRGIGPARQSDGFRFGLLRKLPRECAPVSENGPCGPARLTLLAILFLFREIEVSTSRVSAWSFDHEAQDLTWHLPASKTDHMALGVSRSWPCLCEIPGLACPYHLAVQHLEWLRASPHYVDESTPLFPRSDGLMASKEATVRTFEAVGVKLGQPLTSSAGLRLFGGHSPRVTGAQLFTSMGLEVTKIRIFARHSGDAILRYVAEAPLKSLKADLGWKIGGTSSSSMAPTFAGGASDSTSALIRARMLKLESAVAGLEEIAHTQALDIVAVAAGFARPDERVFVQNTVSAAIHQAKANDGNRTLCGWHFAGARKRGAGAPYRIVHSLVNMPSTMICERCMPTEMALAAMIGIVGAAGVSGDEHEGNLD